MAVEAVEHGAAEAPSATEYILHHLTFLSNKKPGGIVDFSVIHWDSVFFSVLLALLFAGSFYAVARKASSGVPHRPRRPITRHDVAHVTVRLRPVVTSLRNGRAFRVVRRVFLGER